MWQRGEKLTWKCWKCRTFKAFIYARCNYPLPKFEFLVLRFDYRCQAAETGHFQRQKWQLCVGRSDGTDSVFFQNKKCYNVNTNAIGCTERWREGDGVGPHSKYFSKASVCNAAPTAFFFKKKKNTFKGVMKTIVPCGINWSRNETRVHACCVWEAEKEGMKYGERLLGNKRELMRRRSINSPVKTMGDWSHTYGLTAEASSHHH